MKPSVLPPDPEGRNDNRANWAEVALTAFRDATGADREDALADLLGDLMHLCDRTSMSFDEQLQRARWHYDAETMGKGESPRFEFQGDTRELPNRACVVVEDRYYVVILRTQEGIVVEVWPVGWDAAIDCLGVCDTDVNELEKREEQS